jgi:hypothetical protein
MESLLSEMNNNIVLKRNIFGLITITEDKKYQHFNIFYQLYISSCFSFLHYNGRERIHGSRTVAYQSLYGQNVKM